MYYLIIIHVMVFTVFVLWSIVSAVAGPLFSVWLMHY